MFPCFDCVPSDAAFLPQSLHRILRCRVRWIPVTLLHLLARLTGVTLAFVLYLLDVSMMHELCCHVTCPLVYGIRAQTIMSACDNLLQCRREIAVNPQYIRVSLVLVDVLCTRSSVCLIRATCLSELLRTLAPFVPNLMYRVCTYDTTCTYG